MQNININEYGYLLPEEKIAKYPLEQRDSSKLLIYSNSKIREDVFEIIPNILPSGSLLLFNNTKVVHARLLFRKETGAAIEIFCLEPIEPSDYQLSFSIKEGCIWKCLVGNKKKWKTGRLQKTVSTNKQAADLFAEIISDDQSGVQIKFSWNNPNLCFGEILSSNGKMPLPPYLNRDSEPIDDLRYQTVYSNSEGSVAAPTAGLHFTENNLLLLKQNHVTTSELTLHVGAGTFKPVSEKEIANHVMHREHFSFSIETLNQIKKHIGNITLTGTTSMRATESLYWLAAKIKCGDKNMHLAQWEAYNIESELSSTDAIEVIIDYCLNKNMIEFNASTSIMILPGFKFRFADRLITNFHQPKSTLLMLVAAFIGDDWKKIYDFALNHNFRFLSYGDSSLLQRNT